MKIKTSITALFLTISIFLNCQLFAKQGADTINDSNTPLHLLSPDYKIPYREWTGSEIKEVLDRVFLFLEKETPTLVIDTKTKKEITDYSRINEDSRLESGAFRLTTYEWGVTYSAMLEVAKATDDKRYEQYTGDRLKFLSEMAPHFRRLYEESGVVDHRMRQVITPHALDDAGAICAAMIKYQRENKDVNLKGLINSYMDYIMNKEYRLSDGTFARKRPQMNTLWLDDMYMSIPAIAQMGKFTGEQKYYDEAVKQILQFSERMFVQEKGLYMHGWVEGEEYHPAFHWGRANGWALLTMTEVLDVLPEEHSGREKVLAQYKAHVRGLMACQSSEGFWHQLLDRNDSYLETSATAIFVYCIARGINKGWLDVVSFAPAAQLGWSAVSTKVNGKGQVEGVCVGTGMAFDPAFYYYRPINIFAAHGYGPVLMAGAEMTNLINHFYPRMNDSAIQYYKVAPKSKMPIFGVDGQEFN
ncbi:MAG: glycoside hydrolase family 88 protein [Tannerella sp.]|jgi:rhamnogalacturonyl hydrolase YesR|nr:glycoside hydrolase family 88 protein [Tannerella sp.]